MEKSGGIFTEGSPKGNPLFSAECFSSFAELLPAWKIPFERKRRTLMRFHRMDDAGFPLIVVIDAAAVVFFHEGECAAVLRQNSVMIDELVHLNLQEICYFYDLFVGNPYRPLPLAAGTASTALKVGWIHI